MSGSIMQFSPVVGVDPAKAMQEVADVEQTRARTGLLSQQAGAIPSEIALRQAQTGAVPSEIALRNAQATGELARAYQLTPAQAEQARAAGASSLASAGLTGQQSYAAWLANRLNQFGVGQSGVLGGVGAPPGVGGQMLPIGPEISAPGLSPAMAGYLRAVQPSESPPVADVMNHNGNVYTFDPTQGHPGVGHAGYFQLGSTEWAQGAAALGIDPKDFSKSNQEAVAAYTARQRYATMTGRDLEGDLQTGQHTDDVMRMTQQVWPSVTGGSQQNATGASFAQRLPITIAHEGAVARRAPGGGVTGPDFRALPAGAAPSAWTPPPVAAPSSNAPSGSVMIPGMPGPTPAIMAAQPGGIVGSPEQRVQFQTQRANTMQTIFASAPTAEAGIADLAQQGYLTPAQQRTLLANPDTARNFIAQQLPIRDQPTPGVQSQIRRDEPLMAEDAKKNDANVEAAMRAATDQYNLKNIKTLVAGAPDNLLGAAAPTRLAIQKYAQQFGGPWTQGILSKLTGVEPLDVSTLQDLQKAFLSNVLSNERTQGVQRIGALSTQYFQKASPAIDMTKPAVGEIVNLGLIAQQMARDYGDASNGFYEANRKASNESLVSGPYQQYQPITGLEKEWLNPKSIHSPDVYAAAANILNGMPHSKAFDGLSRDQQVEAVRIIGRAEPTWAPPGYTRAP